MIRAYQIDPAYQESHFEPECWPEVIFTGNRSYKSHIPDELKPVFDRFGGDRLIRALHLVTGKEYETHTICGCCQSDWQNVYYPAGALSEAALDALETMYFNTGTEWRIIDEENEDEFYMYCYGWNDELIRAEIANATGTTPENVTLYSFAGYIKTARYQEVTV